MEPLSQSGETQWRRQLAECYRRTLHSRYFRISFPTAAIFFLGAIAANAYASLYANERASNAVTDIILSNIPVFNIDDAFVYGVFVLIALIILLCILHPNRVLFTLYGLGLFYFIRAFFVSLTHLGPFPQHAVLDFQNRIILAMFGGGDQFFSGHTGAPFLMMLMYWHIRPLRYLFLVWSIFFSVIVLLGHIHYSIDVLSAFFITYTIYQIALWLFPKARALFLQDEMII